MTTPIRRISHLAMAASLIAMSFGCAAQAAAPQARAAASSRPQRGTEAVVDSGQLAGATYRIDIPRGWTGALMMYAHGYEVPGAPHAHLNQGLIALRAFLLERGFAVAHSDFRAQGWAVAEGIEDTEALRRFFVARYGRPDYTFVTGHSMGGLIALATIERHPNVYDGAMPLCGPLAPSLEFFADRLFALLVVLDALFPGVLSTPAGLTDSGGPASVDGAAVSAALARDPRRAAALADRFEIRPADLSSTVVFYYGIFKELQHRSGGNPIDNTGTIYSGFGDDVALNRAVRRSRADPRAVAFLRQNYTPSGEISRPVLSIHTTYDPIVAPRFSNAYETITGRAGTQDRYVERFVVGDGHCRIGFDHLGAALDALRQWAKTGARPEGGEMR
jgi:alpha-beta hydrolase superfamily lysophospholipase